jgi:glycerophosphoryl diester phosphodiesterase
MSKAAALVSRPVAHRGLHDAAAGRIENTLGAARAALSHGFGIECDVQISADGEAMVFHDFTLDRLTEGRGEVAKRTAADLAAIPMRGTGDRIAPLSDLLALVGGRQPLIVEVKSRFDGNLRLAARTIELCRAYDGPLGIKSFDPRVTAEVRRLAPDLPRGIVAMNKYDGYDDYEQVSAEEKHALANLLHFNESKPEFVSWRVGDLPCAAPFLCRSVVGLPLMTWTVRTPQDRARAAAHADQMVFEGFVP